MHINITNVRITTLLVVINVLAFVALGMMDRAEQRELLDNYAFSKENFLGGKPWTLLTSLFLHGSLAHLGLNMAALFFFGGVLESQVRRREYLLVFVLGGIAGNALSSAFFPPEQLSIGASGAIFAIVGAAMLVQPFDFVAFPWIIPVPVLFVGIMMVVTNGLLFLFPPPDSNISFAAHIGGFLVGLSYGLHKKGFVRGAMILGVGFAILLILMNYVGTKTLFSFLGLLDYTQALVAYNK